MKKRNSVGATLLELILYIALTSWLALLTASVGYRYLITLNQLGERCIWQADLCAMIDLLSRDIQAAHANPNSWFLTPDQLVFVNGLGYMTGWQHKNKQLFRITGNYDSLTNKWQSVIGRSLVLELIDSCEFELIKDKRIASTISAVHITITKKNPDNKSHIKRMITLNNGIL